MLFWAIVLCLRFEYLSMSNLQWSRSPFHVAVLISTKATTQETFAEPQFAFELLGNQKTIFLIKFIWQNKIATPTTVDGPKAVCQQPRNLNKRIYIRFVLAVFLKSNAVRGEFWLQLWPRCSVHIMHIFLNILTKENEARRLCLAQTFYLINLK